MHARWEWCGRFAGLALVATLTVACSSADDASEPTVLRPAAGPTTVPTAPATTATTDPPEMTTPTSAPPATMMPVTTVPVTTMPVTTVPATIAATTTTTNVPPTTAATSVETDGSTPYRVPVADVAGAGWSPTHAGYPATDIFLPCGAELVSPVDGVVLEVRRVDEWDAEVDNPATRGGRSIAVLGDDGVRYYLAHLDEVASDMAPGVRVAAGARVGTMGDTGRAGACHVHVAISPPCPGPEWSVRRGVVWPYPYLDDWRAGGDASPRAEVDAWLAANPDACAAAMADPNAADAAGGEG